MKNDKKAAYKGCLKYLNAPVVINVRPLSRGGKDLTLQRMTNKVTTDSAMKTVYRSQLLPVICR